MLADVIEEVLEEYRKLGNEYAHFCCILPTAPFITAKRLQEGLALLQQSGADSVVPVVRFSYPIQRAPKIVDNRLTMIWPENMHVRSQDLMPAYHDAGQFYWGKVDSFAKQKRLFAEHTIPRDL